MSLRRSAIPSLFILAAGCVARAQEAPPADSLAHGVARISILDGDVSVRRGDSGDYVAAAVNAPVSTNDVIAAGPNGRAEVQLDTVNLLRLSHDSEVRMADLEYRRFQMQVSRGTVTYRMSQNSPAQVELETPTVSVRPAGSGMYRISVLESGQTEITVRAGSAEIFTPRGTERLAAGQTMIARGTTSDPEYQIVSAIQRDDWDNWCDARDQELARSTSYRYVNPQISGAYDLEGHGRWVRDASYGMVWSPNVAAGWAPYRCGRWVWQNYYGWTWLGCESWGWAPYHYGRWFYGNAGWCWYPGSSYYWSPALVGFFGFGGAGVGLDFGFGYGNVGWVPLAPFETYRPWYGRGGFGFGGRNMIVNNANVFGSFRNARVANAISGVSARGFASGQLSNMAVSGNQLGRAGLVRGQMPIRPSGGAMNFTNRGAGFAPRTNSFSRPFFSSRGVQNPGAAMNRGAMSRTGAAAGGSQWRSFGQQGASQGLRNSTMTAPRAMASAGPQGGAWRHFGGANNTAQSMRGGAAGMAIPRQNGTWQRAQAAPMNRNFGARGPQQAQAPRQFASPATSARAMTSNTRMAAVPRQSYAARPMSRAPGSPGRTAQFADRGAPQISRAAPAASAHMGGGGGFRGGAPGGGGPHGGAFAAAAPHGGGGGGGGFHGGAPAGGGGPHGGGIAAAPQPHGGGGGGGGHQGGGGGQKHGR